MKLKLPHQCNLRLQVNNNHELLRAIRKMDKPGPSRGRLNSQEIRAIVSDLESEEEDEASDVEQVMEIVSNDDDDYDSDEFCAEVDMNFDLTTKDGTQWSSKPLPLSQTRKRNILRQKGGAAKFSNLYTAKEVFKSIMTPHMCATILNETNKKASQINDRHVPFTEEELDAFFGLLLFAGVHRSNKEHVEELWKPEHLPLFRATISRNRFREFLRFIRFDDGATRDDRSKTDKAAAIKPLWDCLNQNLKKGFTPYGTLTVDEQLYGYRGRTKFTQYMPAKPEKYGIKIFWVCDAKTSYPLQGHIYTGKQTDGQRQTNIGERTVLDLVAPYKNTGRTITMDNFFTGKYIRESFESCWNLSLHYNEDDFFTIICDL